MRPRIHRIHEELIRQPPPGMTVALVVAAVLAAALAVVAALASAPVAKAAPPPGTGASFAVRCDFSHRNSDDPIVHPGEEGAAHSHDFFGNTSTKFDATYQSMRAAGTTCTRPEDTGAYWIPTVSWNGQELTPFRAVVYYRAGGKDHTQVKPFDADLRVINDRRITWSCGINDAGSGTATPPTLCENGVLRVQFIFPDCVAVDPNDPTGVWQQLDSADHRSHMVRSVLQSDGTRACPATHPIPVPLITISVDFEVPPSDGMVMLSSGDASTMHADFWNTWDQDAPFNGLSGGLNALVEHCINNVPSSEPRPQECRAPTANA